MRFIIPELPYEQPLAKGIWRYEQLGQPTGAVEQWRLSAAHDGFHFLRVDLDAREAPSGRSYLFHAVLDEQNNPVRLKYRIWQGSKELIGNVHLEPESVLFTSGQGDARLEEVLQMPAGYKFWFPASTAVGLLATMPFTGQVPAVTLVVSGNSNGVPALASLKTTLQKSSLSFDPDNDTESEVVQLTWKNQQRSVWLDSSGWPVRVARRDGLSAAEIQLVLYQQITKPGEAT